MRIGSLGKVVDSLKTTKALPALADQVASNASNALIVFLVAGSSSTAELGSFAMSWAALLFMLGFCRYALSVQVSMASRSDGAVNRETAFALTALAVTAPVTSLVVCLPSLLTTGSVTAPVLVVAMAAPIVLAQDTLRHSSFARGRPVHALMSDSAWLALVAVAIAYRFFGNANTSVIVLIWAGGALLGLLTFLMLDPIIPAISGIRTWFAESLRERLHLSLGGLALTASIAMSTVLIGSLAGTAVVGTLAGAAQLFAPLNTLTALLGIWVLPRAMKASPIRARGLFIRGGVVLGAFCVGWAGLLLLLPNSIGTLALGASWQSSRAILPFVAIQFLVGLLPITASYLLMSQGRTQPLMVVSAGAGALRVLTLGLTAFLVGTALSLSIAETCVLVVSGIVAWLVSCRPARKAGTC